MNSQLPQPDISNISTDSVAPKKRYIKKPKAEIAKEIMEQPVEVIAKEIAPDPVKPKKGQSEKTKLALAEGRKKLAELNLQKRVEREQFFTEQINKKANRIAEEKLKVLKTLNLDETDDEDETILADVRPKTSKTVKAPKEIKEVKPVKAKKPPKVVYISEDEEEEEEQEIIYKVKPKSNNREANVVQPVQQPAPVNKPLYSGIRFY
jgi:hypothetical protein